MSGASTSGIIRGLKTAGMCLLFAGSLFAAGPASAHDHDGDGWGRPDRGWQDGGRHDGGWQGHDGWRGRGWDEDWHRHRHGPPPVVVYEAPPRVIYALPPRPVYPPPGISFVFPLRLQ